MELKNMCEYYFRGIEDAPKECEAKSCDDCHYFFEMRDKWRGAPDYQNPMLRGMAGNVNSTWDYDKVRERFYNTHPEYKRLENGNTL